MKKNSPWPSPPLLRVSPSLPLFLPSLPLVPPLRPMLALTVTFALGLLAGAPLHALSPRSAWPAAQMCAPTADDASFAFRTVVEAAAEQRMRRTHMEEKGEAGQKPPASSVYLVGVGPGDVELLTMKALRLMRSADLVLYDRLISPEVLSLVSEDAAMLYVGKEAGLHTRPQEEIHRLLHLYATSGKTVVRLKGGDPTVFGRGGEELEYLEARGVPVQILSLIHI
mgnify:CR=1 FL=1